jgi:D-sedoheptulose 7-phosphate isomerase
MNSTVSGLEIHLRNAAVVCNETADVCAPDIAAAASLWVIAIQTGHKLLFFGNGGSATQAEHLAAELVGKFYHVRRALPGIALSTSAAILTAVANDIAFDQVFARQIEALALAGDVAIGLSTSGTSKNVVLGIQRAKSLGLKTVALTGSSGGTLRDLADVCIRVPSTDTPLIQEAHLSIGHLLCEEVERSCD